MLLLGQMERTLFQFGLGLLQRLVARSGCLLRFPPIGVFGEFGFHRANSPGLESLNAETNGPIGRERPDLAAYGFLCRYGFPDLNNSISSWSLAESSAAPDAKAAARARSAVLTASAYRLASA